MIRERMCEANQEPPIVGRVRRPKAFDTLEQYAAIALPRLGFPFDAAVRARLAAFESTLDGEQLFSEMLSFSALRVRMSGLIEYAIVLDRYQWLVEQGDDFEQVRLRRIFEAEVSPRNFLITAERKRASPN